MAQVYGQIESFKKLMHDLRSNGITRFNSLKEVNDFLFNFQTEKDAVINNFRLTYY